MTSVDEHGRPEAPLAADEIDTLLGFLDHQRATLEWKCRGLDAVGLKAMVGSSPMSLGGMLEHLARVEESWFTWRLHGRRPLPPVRHRGVGLGVPVRRRRHPGAAARGPAGVREPVARPRRRGARRRWSGATRRGPVAGRPLAEPALIVVHMIEEYARHNGHADLPRESVDGETGE